MLKLYKPEMRDLSYRQALLADEATMAYNAAYGGTLPFPPENWADWYQRWMGVPEDQRYYRYLYSQERACFVGEVAYRYDEEYRAHMVSVIVEAKHRSCGFGKAGLTLLMDAARTNGIAKLCDDIAADNPSVTMFLSMGFTEKWRNDECVMVEKVL